MTIINADDFGRLQSINEAIVYGFDHKILDRTTLMVTEPYVEKAVLLAKEHGFFDKVGLHLNLDEGVPLTENIKNVKLFCDEYGQYNRQFRMSLKTKLHFNDQTVRNVCKEEIEAQINRYLSLGCTLMHIDSHHHVHTELSVLSILIPLAKEYGFKSMRISNNLMKNSLGKRMYKSYINSLIRNSFQTTEFFGNSLQCKNFKSNKSIEMMVHPDVIEDVVIDYISRINNKYLKLKEVL